MEYTFAKSLAALNSSAVREILKLTQGGNVISFAGGLPAEEFFPVAEMKEACERVFAGGTRALQYGLTEGYTPLREWIAGRMETRQIRIGVENLLVTTGSQQAIDLLCRVYLDAGDVILVENPTYLAALQLFQSRGLTVIAVEADADGMLPDDLLAKIQRHHPRMLYVVPTFGNPTGRTWSLERRLEVLRICQQQQVLILEDDPYSELRYEDQVVPSLFALDEHPEGSAVVYTSTFSKTVAPALRTGWAMGDSRIIQAMAKAKQAVDLHSSSLDQQALYQLLRLFDLDAHLTRIRDNYRQRMQLMHTMLIGHGLTQLQWEIPKGGMFLWVRLPEGIDAEQLLKLAVQEGVAFVPGAPFYAGTPEKNTLRMNFTFADGETMKQGIERFARSLQAYSKLVV